MINGNNKKLQSQHINTLLTYNIYLLLFDKPIIIVQPVKRTRYFESVESLCG
jgi:hypothetical protein